MVAPASAWRNDVGDFLSLVRNWEVLVALPVHKSLPSCALALTLPPCL